MFRSPENYCPFRVIKDTIQFGNPVQIPADQIPPEGICSASPTRTEPCEYPDNSEFCPKRRDQDFCDMPWAKE